MDLKELIGKFENGEERFQTSVLFNNVIHHLANGADIYFILDTLIKNSDKMIDELQKAYQGMPIKPIIITQRNEITEDKT